MEGFAKVVNGFHSLTIYAKHSTLDVWQGLKYAFGHDRHDLYHLFQIKKDSTINGNR